MAVDSLPSTMLAAQVIECKFIYDFEDCLHHKY